MPFFIRGHQKSADIKKKIGVKKKRTIEEPSSKKKPRNNFSEEELTSEEEYSDNDIPIEDEEESHQDRKVRLANQYLEEIRLQKAKEIDELGLNEALNQKLREDNLEAVGKLQRPVASTLEKVNSEECLYFRCKQHKSPLTCVVVSNDERFVYSASKDCSIVQWTLAGDKIGAINSRFTHKCNGPKSSTSPCIHHEAHVFSLAISTDGKFLASGDANGVLHIWDGESLQHLKTFKKHKKAISGLCFRKFSHTLFSASNDRLVMVWNLDEMAFVDNLGGHLDSITGIDALSRESCITSGGRDQMVIVYDIPEEKQLRFTGRQSSIDGVKLINEKTFLTFGQSGSIDLWTTLKKKPHHIISSAHGDDPITGEAHWITSAAAFVNTDLVASGSLDGNVKLWKIDFAHRKLMFLFSVPVNGVVNSLEFSSSGSYLVAAVGREHKLGRWYNIKSAKNSLVIIPLSIGSLPPLKT